MQGRPRPLVQRFEPGHLLSQDILGGIEAFACATLSQDTADVTWGTSGDPRMALTPRQLAALGCGYALEFPEDHPERIQAFDNVEKVIVTMTPPEAGQSLTVAVELCRVPLEEWSLGVLERIATYVYFAPITALGVLHPFGRIAGGPTGQVIERPMGLPQVTSDPAPFPVEPWGTNGTAIPGLDVRFHLINYATARQVPDEPPMFVGREEEIPPAPVRPPWGDMRFQWGAKYTQGYQIIEGGHSLLRLFARIRVWGTTETLLGMHIKFVTRLAGFTQSAGPWRAAEKSALQRSW